MSPVSEFEGKTVENAIEIASEALNIPKEKLKYSIMSHGSSGIFGLVGVRKAKIRVTVPEPPAETAKPKAGSHKKQKQSEKPEKSEAAKPKAPSRKKQKPIPEKPETDDFGTEEEIISDAESANHDVPEPEADFSEEEENAGFVNHTEISSEMTEECREVLQRIADSITDEATVSVGKTPDYVCFEVSGGNSAVLIGKRGQTLEAIQYIAEKILNKNTDRRIRVRVDIEGYLNKRKERLETLAKRLSEKVVQTGKPSTIGQMNAHDRRIIHLALRDNTEVRTQSMGEGFYRKLVIFPKKKNAKKKPKEKK